jgi:hypothetical protein
VLTQASLLLPAFILAEATMSYVGLGFQGLVSLGVNIGRGIYGSEVKDRGSGIWVIRLAKPRNPDAEMGEYLRCRMRSRLHSVALTSTAATTAGVRGGIRSAQHVA